jgi:ERCC4-type nuclease
VAPVLTSVVAILSIAAALGAGLAVFRTTSLRSALATSEATVEVLKEARAADREACDREIATMKETILHLESKVAALQSSYISETTKIIMETIAQHLGSYAEQLSAGQRELLQAIEVIGTQVGGRRSGD